MYSSSSTLLPLLTRFIFCSSVHTECASLLMPISYLQIKRQMSIPVLKLHYLFVDKSILQDLACSELLRDPRDPRAPSSNHCKCFNVSMFHQTREPTKIVKQKFALRKQHITRVSVKTRAHMGSCKNPEPFQMVFSHVIVFFPLIVLRSAGFTP
jgi:hypothetical protein